MAIDEHPVHMVFAPVITEHPAIQDGEFGKADGEEFCYLNSVCMYVGAGRGCLLD